MCRTWVGGNAGPKTLPKILHLGTIAQLCRAISSQLRHVSKIGKIVKQQYLLHMSPQYGKLRPTSSWDLLAGMEHPRKFQRVSRLGSVTARGTLLVSVSLAALNRGRHLYAAGWPSRWALAHILVLYISMLLYSYLSFLHRESQFHIVLSSCKFKVLLIIVWFQIVLSVWTNQRPENRVMTNVSVKSES